jgi:hypothetical protein
MNIETPPRKWEKASLAIDYFNQFCYYDVPDRTRARGT